MGGAERAKLACLLVRLDGVLGPPLHHRNLALQPEQPVPDGPGLLGLPQVLLGPDQRLPIHLAPADQPHQAGGLAVVPFGAPAAELLVDRLSGFDHPGRVPGFPGQLEQRQLDPRVAGPQTRRPLPVLPGCLPIAQRVVGDSEPLPELRLLRVRQAGDVVGQCGESLLPFFPTQPDRQRGLHQPQPQSVPQAVLDFRQKGQRFLRSLVHGHQGGQRAPQGRVGRVLVALGLDQFPRLFQLAFPDHQIGLHQGQLDLVGLFHALQVGKKLLQLRPVPLLLRHLHGLDHHQLEKAGPHRRAVEVLLHLLPAPQLAVLDQRLLHLPGAKQRQGVTQPCAYLSGVVFQQAPVDDELLIRQSELVVTEAQEHVGAVAHRGEAGQFGAHALQGISGLAPPALDHQDLGLVEAEQLGAAPGRAHFLDGLLRRRHVPLPKLYVNQREQGAGILDLFQVGLRLPGISPAARAGPGLVHPLVVRIQRLGQIEPLQGLLVAALGRGQLGGCQQDLQALGGQLLRPLDIRSRTGQGIAGLPVACPRDVSVGRVLVVVDHLVQHRFRLVGLVHPLEQVGQLGASRNVALVLRAHFFERGQRVRVQLGGDQAASQLQAQLRLLGKVLPKLLEQRHRVRVPAQPNAVLGQLAADIEVLRVSGGGPLQHLQGPPLGSEPAVRPVLPLGDQQRESAVGLHVLGHVVDVVSVELHRLGRVAALLGRLRPAEHDLGGALDLKGANQAHPGHQQHRGNRQRDRQLQVQLPAAHRPSHLNYPSARIQRKDPANTGRDPYLLS